MAKDWRLNERHYGGLTGLDKAETAARHGAEQVRSGDDPTISPPPPLAPAANTTSPPIGATPASRSARDREPEDDAGAGAALLARRDRARASRPARPYWWRRTAIRCGRSSSTCSLSPNQRSSSVEIPTGNPLLIELDGELRPRAARYLDAARAQTLPPCRLSAERTAPFMRRAIGARTGGRGAHRTQSRGRLRDRGGRPGDRRGGDGGRRPAPRRGTGRGDRRARRRAARPPSSAWSRAASAAPARRPAPSG